MHNAFDTGNQVAEWVDKRQPAQMSKKLQVSPPPMMIMTSQGYGFVPEGGTVLSKGTEAVLAASTTNKQFAKLADKPQPVQMSKKLQVSPPPMAIMTSQAYEFVP